MCDPNGEERPGPKPEEIPQDEQPIFDPEEDDDEEDIEPRGHA